MEDGGPIKQWMHVADNAVDARSQVCRDHVWDYTI